MSGTYPNLAAYNADVNAAREAYWADMAVARGNCGACKERPLHEGRLCERCAKRGEVSA